MPPARCRPNIQIHADANTGKGVAAPIAQEGFPP